MEIRYKKQFLKDLAKLPSGYRKKVEELVFNIIPNESDDKTMQRISKMRGYYNYYKIRIGDYRIGLFIEDGLLEFKRILHRKEIYRYFP
jgi:mRNA interferase RelE/StbE